MWRCFRGGRACRVREVPPLSRADPQGGGGEGPGRVRELLGHHPEILRQQQPPSRLPNEVAILLVDDNKRYLHQLQRVLGKVVPQAALFEANDTNEATYLAQNIQPQLALVDVVLADEDGIRCARRIKAVSSKSRVIMISAYPDREFHRLSIEAGAVAFLDKKDLDARTLRQVVEDLL